MPKQECLDFTTAELILNEPKYWGGGTRIDWVQQGKPKNGFPPSYRAVASVEVIRNGKSQTPEDWQISVYHHAGPNPEIPAKLSMSLVVGSTRICGIDDGPIGGHCNPPELGQRYDGQLIGFPHLHFPVPGATFGYAEPIEKSTMASHWTTFHARVKMTGAPALLAPVSEPKQGDLLT